MSGEVPVTEESVVSVTVMVWFPAVRRMALKLPIPEGMNVSGGRVAAGSVLLKRTRAGLAPAKLKKRSKAEMMKLKPAPLETDAGTAEKANWLVAPACTPMGLEA